MSLSILVHSNAPWASSGYGKITRYICPQFKALGHKVTVSAFYGLQGGVLDMEGIEILPAGLQHWGNDIIEAHARRCKADVVIAVIDPWVLREFGHKLPGKFYPWFPVDGSPVASQLLKSLDGCTKALVYSKFAEEELKRVGFNNVAYVPIGFDSKVFFPAAPTAIESKKLGKKHLNIPEDSLLFTMIAANSSYPSRKCFEQHIEAFTMFHKEHPNSILYIHTDVLPIRGGISISDVISILGAPIEAIKFPNRYEYQLGLSESEINKLLNATDLYLGASAGEGFGLPLIESLATGTPVVTTKATSTEELCGSGWLVPPVDKRYYALGTFHFPPDVDKIYQAMKEFVESDREELFQSAVEFAKDFTWTKITDKYWVPVLDEVEKRISGPRIAKPAKYPKVAVLSVIGPDPVPLSYFISFLNELDYPRNRIRCYFAIHPRVEKLLTEKFLPVLEKPFVSINNLHLEQYKTRREEVFSLSNLLLDQLDNEDYVLVLDADLCRSNSGLLKALVSYKADIVAPLTLLDNTGDWYYDASGFRKDGRYFYNTFPYFAGMTWEPKLVEVDSVGTCYLVKREIVSKIRYRWDLSPQEGYGHVFLCNEARRQGRKVFIDTGQIVYHSQLERYHSEEHWQAQPEPQPEPADIK